MDLAWGTILALVLLTPGFAFHAGLFSVRGISRETRSRSLPTELCFLVLSSLLIHLVLRALYAVLGTFCSFFDISVRSAVRSALCCVADTHTLSTLSRNVADHIGLLVLHLALSLAAGFALGRWPGRALLRGPLRGLIRHAWVYDMVPKSDTDPHVTYAYVMTKTQHNEFIHCYRGPILQLGLTDDGRFSYVVLRAPARFYVRLENNHSTSTEPIEIGKSRGHRVRVEGRDAASAARYQIHISGDSIENIVFADVPRPVGTLQQLEARIAALEGKPPVPGGPHPSQPPLTPAQPTPPALPHSA